MEMPSNKPRVLVVNDDPSQREMTRDSIQGICQVICPQDHAELVALLPINSDSFAGAIVDYLWLFWKSEKSPFNARELIGMLQPNKYAGPFVFVLTQFPDNEEVKKLKREYPSIEIADYKTATPRRISTAVKLCLKRWEADRQKGGSV